MQWKKRVYLRFIGDGGARKSLATFARLMSMAVRGIAEVFFEFAEFVLEHFGGGGFEVQAEHRFGVALADVEPTVAQVDRDAVEVVDLPFFVGVSDLADLAVLVFDLEIHFAGLAVALERIDQRGHFADVVGEDREEASEGDGAGACEEGVAEGEMAGELATEDGLGVGEGLFDEGVTN